jgi:hypothetical protein
MACVRRLLLQYSAIEHYGCNERGQIYCSDESKPVTLRSIFFGDLNDPIEMSTNLPGGWNITGLKLVTLVECELSDQPEL